MKRNPYDTIHCKLEQVIEETPTIKTFVLRPEKPLKFKTGQFVDIELKGVGECPFTPSSSPLIETVFDVTVMKVGHVTEKLHQLKPGQALGVRGPYGTGYPVEKFHGKEIVIVGGGCGLAPLRSLLFTLFSQMDKFKRVVLTYGAKTEHEIVYKHLFPDWNKIKGMEILRSVDKCETESWNETQGVVTVLLDKCKLDHPKEMIGIVCGPPIMMKFATRKLLEKQFRTENIYLSLEKNMSCGMGKCGHCQLGPYFVCKDGPVFNYAQIKNEPEIWS